MKMKEAPQFQVERCSIKALGQFMLFARKMNQAGVLPFILNKNIFLNKYRAFDKGVKDLNLFLLKTKTGKIIGCSGYQPFKGRLNKQTIKGIICVDAVIDPVYREKFPGLFLLLFRSYEQLLFRDKSFPLLFPFGNITKPFTERLFWEEFVRIDELRKLLFSKPLPKLRTPSIKLKKIVYFSKEINSFFKRVSGQHDFIIYADRDFLNWKYFDNPYCKYVVIQAERNKIILGYIVVELRNSNIEIVDIVVDLEYPQLIVMLVYESLTYFNKHRVKSIFCYLTHEKYKQVLARAGFLSQRSQICLFFKVALLFSLVDRLSLDSSDKNLYHFNGITRYLY